MEQRSNPRSVLTSGTTQRPTDEIVSLEHPCVIRCVQQYREALEAGETPDRESLLRMFPQITDELSACLGALEIVHQMAPRLHEAQQEASWPIAGPGAQAKTLGDFRILREIGRGGMGVVYEAEQVSLRRHVALKVLPLAAVLDPRHLQRFRTEAQAAATLHHQNIVPVYGVGCERGVHYYAMQYIEGQPLSAVIRDLRRWEQQGNERLDAQAESDEGPSHSLATGQFDPPHNSEDPNPDTITYPTPSPSATPHQSDTETVRDGVEPKKGLLLSGRSARSAAYFRTVAGFGIQVAEALDFAHQQGVIHRDIKPSNLILDPQGKLWVTDFGLARVQDRPEITLTGDLVGTLRYMSPEQAMAQRVVVDHRTDIYSLGITLYELIALQPAFRGKDRQQLHHQIAFEEPPRLRQLNRSTPTELETVILKAIAKNPVERYATAQDLADDLRRFLNDQPVLARRPLLALRLVKWSRRHRQLVRLALAVLLMAAIAGPMIGVHEASLRREAVRQKNAAAEARRLERKARLLAQTAEKKERHQRQQAEENFDKARAAVDTYLTTVSESKLLRVPGLQPLRKELLEASLSFYQWFIQQRGNDPELRSEMAQAYRRVASITGELGLVSRSRIALQDSIAIYEELLDQYPDDPEYQDGLADTLHNLASLLRNTHEWEAARENCDRAIAIREIQLDTHSSSPRFRDDYANHYCTLGILQQAMGHNSQARASFEKAVEIRTQLVEEHPLNCEYQSGLVFAYRNLARQQISTGEYELARVNLKKAVEIGEAITDRHPSVAEYLVSLAESHNGLAGSHEESGEHEAAMASREKAIEIGKWLVRENPAVPEYEDSLASTHQKLGALQDGLGKKNQARGNFQEAITIRDRLTKKYPEVLDYKSGLAVGYNSLGIMEHQAGRLREAEEAFCRAISIQEELAECSPDVLRIQGTLATYYHQLGAVQDDSSRPAEALPTFKKELDLLESLAESNPEVPEYRDRLASCHLSFGIVFYRFGQTEQAVQNFNQTVQIRDSLVQEHPSVVSYRSGLGRAYDKLAVAQRANDQLDSALASQSEAIRILEKLAADTQVFQHQNDLADAYNNLGVLLGQLERDEEAIRAHENAREIYERLFEVDRSLIDVQAAMGGCHCNIGNVLRRSVRYAEADESFAAAIRTLTDALRRVPQHATSRIFLRNSYWGKARSLEAQTRHDEASSCWERAIEFDDGQADLLLRTSYAASLARAGQHVRSIQIAESLLQSKYVERFGGLNAYNAACVYALSAESASRDGTLAPEDRQKTADEYARKAVDRLRLAWGREYFKEPDQLSALKSDPDLAFLRDRDDFQATLSDIEGK